MLYRDHPEGCDACLVHCSSVSAPSLNLNLLRHPPLSFFSLHPSCSFCIDASASLRL